MCKFMMQCRQPIAGLAAAISGCPPQQAERLAHSLFNRLVWLALLGDQSDPLPPTELWAACNGRSGCPTWLQDLLRLPRTAAVELDLAAIEAAATFVADAADRDLLSSALIGALVEQAAERKQSGVYFTGADVTTYIATASIVPLLLDNLAARQPAEFAPGGPAWACLREDPDRYIYVALCRGCDLPLPPAIATGCANTAARTAWNRPAPAEYGLPGEIWREHLARREQVARLRHELRQGSIVGSDALISRNLDLRRFLLDWIAGCKPDALADLLDQLEHLRVLDPTCGAGAFLLAAADLLTAIYRAALNRAAQFPSHADLAAHRSALPDEAGLRAAIVRRNLYGIDIADETVAACRMRLALWLAECNPPGTALPCSETIVTADILDGTASPFAAGSFDVIIGNPPYRVRRHSRRDYPDLQTAASGNLYAMVVERSLDLLRPGGRLGMLVPIAAVSTENMRPLQQLYRDMPQWHSHYAVRPGKLFAGVDMNLTISLLCKRPAPGQVFSTGYRRWSNAVPGARAALFPTLRYTPIAGFAGQPQPFPKLGSPVERLILQQMLAHGRRLREYRDPGGPVIYYHSGGRYWRKALWEKLSSHYKPLAIRVDIAPIAFCLLNSQLFYWYWIAHSNCMDLVARDVLALPVFALEQVNPRPFAGLAAALVTCYRQHGSTRRREGTRIKRSEINIDMAAAHPLIDQIDGLLAEAYGFTAEQLDFVRSYDIKYRQR
jgi:SAM-dependent methyltransferase